jgi:hypothetical protein
MNARLKVMTVLAFLPLGLDAQSPLEYRLSVTRAEGGPTMPRLRLDLDHASDTATTRLMRTIRLKGALDLASRADRNTEDSFIEGDVGYRMRIGTAPPLDIDDPNAIDTWPNPMLGIYGDGRFETNQSFSEQLVSGQVRAVFTHVGWRGLILLVPQAEVAFGLTRTVASDTRDATGLPSSASTRVEAQAVWRVAFGRFATGIFDKLWFFGELRAFHANGMEEPFVALGYSKGTWIAARLMYEVQILQARGVFVQYSRGRVPTQPSLLGAWQVGLRR